MLPQPIVDDCARTIAAAILKVAVAGQTSINGPGGFISVAHLMPDTLQVAVQRAG
jgi:hypothetical protein